MEELFTIHFHILMLPALKNKYFLVLLLYSNISFADPFVSSEILKVKGFFVNKKGYKISWETPRKIDSHTDYTKIDFPRIKIHVPQNLITIQSDILKIDSLLNDYIFKDHVILKTPRGTLKTDFLKFNSQDLSFTSFDHFTFQEKDTLWKGRAFFGSESSRKIQLFNLKNTFSSSLSLPLL